jgi:hypothetical protein
VAGGWWLEVGDWSWWQEVGGWLECISSVCGFIVKGLFLSSSLIEVLVVCTMANQKIFAMGV